MDFADPIPFEEAIRAAEARGVLPTGLSSLGLRDVPAQVRRASLFSARTTNAGYLQTLKDTISRLLSPENRPPGQGINIATARAELQDQLDALGYSPERGFGDDSTIPPAKRGSLRDLSSNARLNLVLKTQTSQMANLGYQMQQDTPFARQAYPCWELVRIGKAKTMERDWPERWTEAGGEFYDGGRMIAAKDSPVWAKLGSTELFDDALDTEHPPFAYGSHMGWRAVPRDECVALGVIGKNEIPKAANPNVAHATDANIGHFDDDFLASLEGELDGQVQAGKKSLSNRSGESLAVLLLSRALHKRGALR